jgi:hypothetical protein
MAHPIHKHMHTHITKQNVKAAIRDDKAHMDYLKRDIKDDQKFHAKDKDARQLHDEQHITNLARDVKDDERKEHISRRSSSPFNEMKGENPSKKVEEEISVEGGGHNLSDIIEAKGDAPSRKSSPFHADEKEEPKKDTDKEDKKKAAQTAAKVKALDFLKS